VVAGPFLPRAVPSGTQAIAASPTLRLREMSRLLRLLSVAGRARSRGLACSPRGTFGVVMARPYFSTWQRDRTRGALQEVPQPLPANARPDRLISVRLFSAPQALKRAVQQLPHSIPSRYPRRAPLRRRLYPLLYRRREIPMGRLYRAYSPFVSCPAGYSLAPGYRLSSARKYMTSKAYPREFSRLPRPLRIASNIGTRSVSMWRLKRSANACETERRLWTICGKPPKSAG